MSCLYILEFKPLSVASFANIFSHMVGCLGHTALDGLLLPGSLSTIVTALHSLILCV